MSYLAIKYAHVGTAIASFGLFFLRGLWMMAAPEKLVARWVRMVPHVIDTVLLVSPMPWRRRGPNTRLCTPG